MNCKHNIEQAKQDKILLKDIFVVDFLNDDLDLNNDQTLKILTAFIRYYAKEKRLIESLIIKSIDNVDLDKFLFFTDQLRILNKTHKRLVHIKYFKITN
tara:strand:+ start:835 stop:1131 length:297 start_codon:yes stop_codon:yes gene_type:complete